MNPDLLATPPHPSKAISDAVAGDPEIVNLTVGEPGYGPPDRFLEAVRARLAIRGEDPPPDYNRYAHSRGVPALRRAISEYYGRRYDLTVDPDRHVLVTHGGAEAIWLTVFALTAPGDEVLIPDPGYMLFEPITRMLGRRPVRVPTRAEAGFVLTPAALEPYAGARSRLLILNSPANPMGTLYDRASLEALAAWARERRLHVLHDEVFDSTVFAGEHTPALGLVPDGEHVILVNSFSKRFGMTGWRLGWLVGGEAVVATAAKAHTLMTLATGTLMQQAAAETLNDPACLHEVADHARALGAKAERFVQGLLEIPGFTLPAGQPAAGFYLFPDVTDFRRLGLLAADGPADDGVSGRVARHLLERAKVAVVPGDAFGACGEGHVRISFAAPEAQLQEALARFRRVLGGGGA